MYKTTAHVDSKDVKAVRQVDAGLHIELNLQNTKVLLI